MPPADDLLNKGFIVSLAGQQAAGAGRTFIVTGLLRSGTSLVASILSQAGLFIGTQINDIVYEDEEIARTLTSGDTGALNRIIAERNASYRSWGFKLPMLFRYLEPAQMALFNDPHLIVTFRDPVSISVRTSLSDYRQPMQSMHEATADLTALMAFVGDVRCPNLLLSYEKALTFPHDIVDAIMRFCGIPPNAALHRRLIGMIEPNRPRYTAGARRRYEGRIEGIMDGGLYGWCRLTHSTDPVTLEVLVDEKPALSVAADVFRQDLLDARIGEGRHGFFIALEALQAGPDAVIRIKAAAHGVELDHSGQRLREFGSPA